MYFLFEILNFCAICFSKVTKKQTTRQTFYNKKNIMYYTTIMRLLCCIVVCLSLLFMEVGVSPEFNLTNVISASSSVVVYHDGNVFKPQKSDKQQIMLEFNKLISQGHEMPAFGVALDEETRNRKQQGVFVEFCFNEIMEYNQMPFCRLLVEVNPEFNGFNIIRYNDAKYEGRCFYVSLGENTMQNFYDFILCLESCNCDTIVS